jgi:hypothetical protein
MVSLCLIFTASTYGPLKLVFIFLKPQSQNERKWKNNAKSEKILYKLCAKLYRLELAIMPTFFLNSGPLSKGSRFVLIRMASSKRNFNDVSVTEINNMITGLLGSVKYIGRMKNGMLLVETINLEQAETLCRTNALNDQMYITTELRYTFNLSKDIDTCFDLNEPKSNIPSNSSQICLDNVSIPLTRFGQFVHAYNR